MAANNPWFLDNSQCQTSTKVISFFIQTKLSSFNNTLPCHVPCVDLMEWVLGGKLQDVPLMDGVYVFSAASGPCSGFHFVWTVATIPKSFAPDVVKLNIVFKPIVVEKSSKNDHLISFIFKLNESIFENLFTFLPILKSLTISQLIWRNLSVPF